MGVYALTNGIMVVRTADGAMVPPTDAGNPDSIAYRAWVAAGNTPDPAPVPSVPSTVISSLVFISRFSPAEEQAIMTASQTSWAITLWITQMSAAGTIDVANTMVLAGMAALVTAGLITSERSTQILNLAVASP